MTSQACPCGLGQYESCCGPYITGTALPETPEALMRSRYTAYTQGNIDYIVATQSGPAADDYSPEDARIWAKSLKWEGLEVFNTETSGDIGFVRFDASYQMDRKHYVLSEYSQFHRVDGRWIYWASLALPGHTPVNEGKNAPCHCGSGKKFKRCCGKT
ncbi:MAG: YchJ family protein [Gammaproteobacteria bacterium]